MVLGPQQEPRGSLWAIQLAHGLKPSLSLGGKEVAVIIDEQGA